MPVFRTRVFGDESEIAVDKPEVLGGHTTAGYDSLNLLVETVVLKMLLKSRTLAVMEARTMMRRFFMQSPRLLSHAFVDLQVAQEQESSQEQ